jgi:hypothetical protein
LAGSLREFRQPLNQSHEHLKRLLPS